MRGRTAIEDCVYQLRCWLRAAEVPSPDLARLNAALGILDASDPPRHEGDSEEPIFVLATSWRSGSTLMQRILCTDPSVFLWGEPLGRLALLSRIVSALCAVTTDWPPRDFWLSDATPPPSLDTSWVANLFPPGRHLRSALRELLLRWLGVPARELGFRRWGFKEVRLGAAEARLLGWLFPGARIVAVVRHPFDAYRSLSRALEPGKPWDMYSRWPDHRLTGAASFARHWDSLTTSWLEAPSGPSHLVVRYEDLAAGRVDARQLERFLGLELDERRALAIRIGATGDRTPLRAYEKWLIAREARRGMAGFGYSGSAS